MAGFEVHGYVECECGELLPHTDLRPAPALCPACQVAAAGKASEARLTYEIQGRTFHTPPPRKPKRAKPKKKPLTPEQKDARRRLDRARMRAYVRLAGIYRPMYEMLLNEEKLREGLPPDTKSRTPRPRAVAATLLADIDEAHERAARERQPAHG